MKKKSSIKSTGKPPEEIEKVQRKILDDLLLRDRLEKECGENPSEEKQREIARLTAEIEENQRISGAFVFAGLLETLDENAEKIIDLLLEKDDGVFLNPGNREFFDTLLLGLIRLRNEFYDYRRHFLPREDAQKVIDRYEEIINRFKQIIEEKRKNAAARYPELAKYLQEPDFEMPEEYKKALDFVMQMIEKREELAKKLKHVVPERRKKFTANLAEMDKLLDNAEQTLATLYERHQKKQRYIDGLRKMFSEASQSELHSLREHIEKNPGELPEIEKLLAEEFPE